MAGEAARRAQRALLRDRCSCMHGVLGCGALVRMLMRIDMHNASGRNTRIWLYSHALAYTCIGRSGPAGPARFPLTHQGQPAAQPLQRLQTNHQGVRPLSCKQAEALSMSCGV